MTFLRLNNRFIYYFDLKIAYYFIKKINIFNEVIENYNYI